ncbi:MFS transporter [Saccharomonospora sp. NPDC006951]
MNKHRPARDTADQQMSSGHPVLMLVLATVGFALNFWAWALLSPLAAHFTQKLDLSSFEQSAVVAVPVLVGSVGRIPVGALTDRYGGRILFPLISVITVIPVLFLGFLGHSSLAALLIGGFFLGIGGTAFAIGVPFVNAWFPPGRRGFAIGVFGMGMGGTAIAALTTVNLMNTFSLETPFVVTAVALVIYAIMAALLLRDAPARPQQNEPLGRRLAETMRLPATWQASALYALAFGGYVAFSVYLPSYLKNAYELSPSDASNRMAGFVLLAVVMRPVGGWLSDKFGAVGVTAVALAVVTAGAAVQSFTPDLMPVGTIAFLAMAGALGAGSGAVFALVALLTPPGKVGSVTGFVGAAGGLGGFVPPLVMGGIYGALGSYALGLAALALVSLLLFVFATTTVRKAVDRHARQESTAGANT